MLPFGVGMLELTVVVVVAAVTFTMFVARISYRKWSAAILVCVALAAILTPPDLFSMLLMSTAFIAVYFGGTRHHVAPGTRRDHIPNVAH